MPPLPASLTDVPCRFLRLLEQPRLQSMLCDYTTDVPVSALHEAIRAPGEVTGKTPTHLCDTWRWLVLEGELYAVSDLQAMLTTNGLLITITANVKTATGVEIITHCPVAMAQSPPLLAFAQTADAASGELLPCWKPFFQQMYSNSLRTRLKQLRGRTEADQVPECWGTQFSKLVLDPISQRLRSQLQSPWAVLHKKDAARQWAVILDMPTRPLNTPHVAPDKLHQMYPYVLWSAAMGGWKKIAP